MRFRVTYFTITYRIIKFRPRLVDDIIVFILFILIYIFEYSFAFYYFFHSIYINFSELVTTLDLLGGKICSLVCTTKTG